MRFNFRAFKTMLATALLVSSLFAYPVRPAAALDLGDALKKGGLILGGGALVKLAAGPLNDFINTVTFNNNAKYDGYTKVVPIVSFGDGTHIGAAQVGGANTKSVESVQAVAQLEADFHGVRIKILIPIDTLNVIKQFKRVQGVGLTALIDATI